MLSNAFKARFDALQASLSRCLQGIDAVRAALASAVLYFFATRIAHARSGKS